MNGKSESKFEKLAESNNARSGLMQTAHGSFNTPAFMPVATQGAIKGATTRDLREMGAEILLANTYHLHLRPGEKLVGELGGLHKFMGWDGPILTDSGGYQVYSLAKLRKLDDDGVVFQSHIDGAEVRLSPEKVIEIQQTLGVDIMMVLDECLPYPATWQVAEASLRRTLLWAKRSKAARTRNESLMFGILQGGMYRDLRKISAEGLIEIGFDGYAIGGLSVGEPTTELYEFAEYSASLLPQDKVRYLMGVGTPSDIVNAVSFGIDMFDCVMPTRSARFGRLFVKSGHINIRNAEFRADSSAIDEGCDCYTCQNFSKAYLSHLVHAKEVLAVQLATIHNLRFYQRLMSDIRAAIKAGCFSEFSKGFLANRKDSSQLPSAGQEDNVTSL